MARPSARLFAVLLLAAIPPMAAFAAISVFAGPWLADRGFGAGTQLLIGAGITVAWATVVTLWAGRFVAGEARSMLELAQRGTAAETGSQPDLSDAQRRLAATLDERNRQISMLAETVHRSPISDEPETVAASMVAVTRSLTADPTWVLVVLRGPDDLSLSPGAHGPDPNVGPEAVEEVHRWASTIQLPNGGGLGARFADGPWGAFTVVDVAAGEDLRAILMAPWEGRPPPSPAELALFSLLGQHAATAIEHALLYTRLRSQSDELNRMAAIQTDFLRGVTHDLQTPLTSIRALAAELRESVSADSAAAADLDTIAQQADRLRRMVGQLLVASRLEAGALTPRQEVFRVEPIVQRTWEALRVERPFMMENEGPPFLLVADPDRVEQVLWAVLDNAVRYSPDNSPIRVELAPGTGADEVLCRIRIRDEGAGMDPDALEHAFDQFYRSDIARRLSPDGSGLGLHAARGLVRAMGGDMSAASRLGEGTTVEIVLPAEMAEDSEEGASEGASEPVRNRT